MNTQITSASLRGATRPLALAALLAVGLSSSALAQTTWTWNGGDGEYTVGANWDQTTTPNLTSTGNVAVINSGNVTYTPGGDLFVNNGATLRINGGSWTQVGGVAWMQFAGGNLVVAGGTFNQGTAGNIVRGASTTITVTSGTANLALEFADQGTLAISGGTLNTTGNIIHNTGITINLSGSGTLATTAEFKPVETFTMSGGALTANLISFADGTGGINFSSGLITLNGGGANSGFYGGDLTKGLNFTESSAGTLFFSSYSATELNTDGFLTNGTIQFNGAVDAGAFTVTEADGGVYVSLTSTIPEPSTFAALAGLGVLGLAVSRRRRAAN